MSTAYERLLNDIKDAKYSSYNSTQKQLNRKLERAEKFAGNFLELVAEGFTEKIDPTSLAIVILELKEKIEELEYAVSDLEDRTP